MDRVKSEDRIKTNSIYNLIKTVSTILFQLLTFPYVSRILEPENMGKVDFSNSIISYFTLLAMLGMSTYAIRICSQSRDDKKLLNTYINELLSINILTSIISYFILFFLLFFSTRLQPYRSVIIVQSFSIFITVLGADWLNTAMEDFKYITVRTLFFQICSLLLIVLLVRSKDDYLKYVMINVFCVSGSNFLNIFYRRKYCIFKFTVKLNLKKHITPIIFMLAMNLAQIVYVNSDMTILGLSCGDREVGIYSAAVKIYMLINSVIASISLVVMPKLSYYFTSNDYFEINNILRFAFLFLISLGFPCIIGINLLAEESLIILGGEKYIAGANALRFLSVALLFSLMGGFIGNAILLPSKRESVCLKNCCISAVFNIVLNLIFIPKFGLLAAAATTAVSEAVAFLLGLLSVEKDIVIHGLVKIISKVLIGCAGMIVVYYCLARFEVSNAFIKFLIVFPSCSLVYLVLEFFLRNELFKFSRNIKM